MNIKAEVAMTNQYKKLNLPLSQEELNSLKAGDGVLLSGIIYTARDAAHKRLVESIKNNQPLPFDMQGATIYYVGPCPAKKGDIIGSCGPTTSYRCDPYTLPLLEKGLKGMIGKGVRGKEVIDGMIKHGAVYYCGIGGAGALYASCVVAAEIIAYDDLGAEAVRKLTVKDLPVIVGIDSKGNSAFFAPQ